MKNIILPLIFVFLCSAGSLYSSSASADNSSGKTEEKEYKNLLTGKWRYCYPRMTLKKYIRNDEENGQAKKGSLPDFITRLNFIFFKDGKVLVNIPKDGFKISGSTTVQEYKIEGNIIFFKMYRKGETNYFSSMKLSYVNNDEINVIENHRGEEQINKLYREK